LRRSEQCALPDFYVALDIRFAVDAGDGERIVPGSVAGAGFSTAGDEGDRRIERRESSAGSERCFCDHAGADRFRWRRNTRSSGIVAGAGRDRSEWSRVYCAVCRKRGPVRRLHRGECGEFERRSCRWRAWPQSFCRKPNKIPAQAPAAQPIPHFGFKQWFANVGVTKRSGGAVRDAGSYFERRFGGGLAGERSPESSADEASGERGVSEPSSSAGSENSASAPSGAIEAGRGQGFQARCCASGSGVVPTNAPASAEIQSNPVSSNWLPEDKRSCRALAADVPLP